MRTYKLKLDDRARTALVEKETRARIERAALDTFECPRCGEAEPPFLDMFDPDLVISCAHCAYLGPLKDFLS